MQLHTTLQPLPTAPAVVQHLLNSPQNFIGDGAYSRVVIKNDFEVLKVTSCEASIKLLMKLMALTASGSVPMHLPQVFRAYGTVAMDADGKCFEGFIVERLFEPDEYADRLRARASMRLAGVGRDSRARTLRPDESAKLFRETKLSLAEACASAYEYRYEGWVESTTLAGFVAVDSKNPLKDVNGTFTLLEEFVAENHYELDLLTNGNLKVSAQGVPVLADPVAERALDIECPEPCVNVPAMCGFAVLEETPSHFEGTRLAFQWVTRAHADSFQEAWSHVTATMGSFPHSPEFRVVRWRGPSHRELLAASPRLVPVESLRPMTQMELMRPSSARHPDLQDVKLPKAVRRFLNRGNKRTLATMAKALSKLMDSCLQRPSEEQPTSQLRISFAQA